MAQTFCNPSENTVTPETRFWNRRSILKALGLGLISTLPIPKPLFSVQNGFPSNKNSDFSETFNGLTEEKLVTNYNNFYEFTTDKKEVAEIVEDWKNPPQTLEVAGRVHRPRTFGSEELADLFGLEQRIYRFRCVEAWSMVVPWDGFPLRKLLDQVQPLGNAKFVKFTSFLDPEAAPGQRMGHYPWPYVEGLRLDEAMNDLTLMVGGVYGKPLPKQNGSPWRLIVPWKYGFKSIKSIVRIELTDKMPASLWMSAGPSEYGFYANVNPEVDHPRWSQKRERPLGNWFDKVGTLMFNGYSDQVGHLYQGMDLNSFY